MKNKLISTDLEPMNLEEAKVCIGVFIKLRRPVFLHGPVGVGKSDLIAQIGKEQNRKVIDLRMSQMDLSDLRGIPYYNIDTKKMEWAPPCVLPTNANDTSILFLDELNCASPSIQATAYQLILDRKVGDYTLPEGVSVIAAGNRDKDRGATFRMATPLLNRFVHLDIRYDFNTWKNWAELNDIHKTVLNYLANYRKDLATFNPGSQDRAFATPRSWKYVSDCIHELTVGEDLPSAKSLSRLVGACIGENLATKFLKWYSISERVSIDDILSGEVVFSAKNHKKDSDISYLLDLSHELSARLKLISDAAKDDVSRNHFYTCLSNAFTYLASHSNREIPLSFLSILVQKYDIVLNRERVPALKDFLGGPESEFLMNAMTTQ